MEIWIKYKGVLMLKSEAKKKGWIEKKSFKKKLSDKSEKKKLSDKKDFGDKTSE